MSGVAVQDYEALLGEIADVVKVIDDAGVIQYESPSVERTFGYSQDQLLGENVLEYVHPEDRDEALATLADVLEATREGGQTESTATTELRFRHADGHWVWVESQIRTNDDSALDGHVVVTRPIDERRRREAELRQLQELLARAEAVADVGGWEVDVDTQEVFWTGHLFEMLGWESDEEPPLEEALDVYHPEDRDRVEAAVTSAMESGESFEIEARYHSEDDEQRWFRIQGVPTVEDGEVVTLRGAVVDITEQVERERELEAQNERLEEFASVVSHDLRNPLAAADAALELARRECDSDHLDEVADAHDRMVTLIDDLLTLAREGADADDVVAVNLQEVITDCWGAVGDEAVTLSNEATGRIRANPSRLRQLLENLLRNAVEHGGDDVTVTIGDLDDGFYVEDDGPGIPPEDRDRVTDAGFSTNTDGTGFGLRIVEAVADAHDWTLSIGESAAGGARFEIRGVERLV